MTSNFQLWFIRRLFGNENLFPYRKYKNFHYVTHTDDMLLSKQALKAV